MFTRRSKVLVAAVTLAPLLAVSGAASAQTLPDLKDPAWRVVGNATGATYAVFPDSIVREGQIVRFIMRAEMPPPADATYANSIVARIVVDCAAGTIGRGLSEFYSVSQGLAHTVEEDSSLQAVSDPGQTLLIQHVCAD